MIPRFREDAQKLVGCTLTDISVRTYRAEFVFMDEMTIILRLNKEFGFSLPGFAAGRFDPTVDEYRPSDSSAFVLLRGRLCRGIQLAEGRLAIDLDGGASLSVDWGDRDFEPLELVGSAGQRHEKLEFYHVL
jgi:hypothetical protein